MGRLSCCLSVPRDARILENFIFKIFKILHDEFLYDESLNSYHSHIYMLARLWATHLLYCLWALSVVKLCRPLGACHVVKSRLTCTFTHICYFYSGSTIHIYPSISISRTTKKYSTPNPGENNQKYFCFLLVK
jgi:hypothetical protein